MIEELRRLDVRQFIAEHADDDPAALALQSRKYPDLPIRRIAHQIKSRQKAKTKLPTYSQNPDIIYPEGVSLEQCSSEATAQYKANLISGASITDLTGGLGIDAYYFAKRFKSVCHVESNHELSGIADYNFSVLGIQNISTSSLDCFEYLSNESKATDYYFIDPARRSGANQKVHLIQDCRPNLIELLPMIGQRGARAMIKLSPLLDIQAALSAINNVVEVHVISVKNECKELLLLVDYQKLTKSPKYIAANILGKKTDVFDFEAEQESNVPEFGEPEVYLYEPNSSIMKAGAFNSVATHFDIKKLHRNSHLYTSSHLISDFPGRAFRIIQTVRPNTREVRKAIPDSKVNIAVRNYPQSVAKIRKQLELKEGGNRYLFATTLTDGKPTLLLCEKER